MTYFNQILKPVVHTFFHILALCLIGLTTHGVAVAADVSGPWLVTGSVVDGNSNPLQVIENVVFFDQQEDSLIQLSRVTGLDSDAEKVVYNRSGVDQYELESPLAVHAYAGSELFSQLQLNFNEGSLSLSGLVETTDSNLTYSGTGRVLHPTQLEAGLFTLISGLAGQDDATPLLFEVNVPDATSGMRVRLFNGNKQELATNNNVKLTVLNGQNLYFGDVDEKGLFLSEVIRENPQAGSWYVMVDTDASFSDVFLLVEIGDVLNDDGFDPTDPTDPTDPQNPTTPSTPTNPLDPSDPTNPSDPSDPSDPSTPTDPIDGSDPTDASDLSDPVAPVEIITPHVGWWWNPDESGRGYSIEFQNEPDVANKNALFVGAYLYDESGTAVWHTALLEPLENRPNEYKGSLLDFKDGSTLQSTRYFQPRLTGTSGVVRAIVISEDQIRLELPGGTNIVEPFEFSTNTDQQNMESGWWWNPFTPGQGYFMEQQGDVIYFVSYLYNAAGDAVWYTAWLTSNETVRKGSLEYTGRLLSYAGGQTLTGDYKIPFLSEDNGHVSIVFQTETLATIDWPGGIQTMQRFYFRKQN